MSGGGDFASGVSPSQPADTAADRGAGPAGSDPLFPDAAVSPDGRDRAEGEAAAGGEVPRDRELQERVFLARVLEPGDETGGRWVRERGVLEVARRLREGGRALPGVGEKRWAGLCARAGSADPRRDLAVARSAGARFVVPGTAEWPAFVLGGLAHVGGPCL
ncbi:DNA-processing protein DprA, partial [Streptomyces tendae]